MTIAELLALLGRAWSRLALYPGGLFALAVVWAVWRRRPAAGEGQTADAASLPIATLSLAAPLLAISLLPLPGAAPLGRPVDLAVALALLELPRLIAAASDVRAGGAAGRRGARRLAAALNGYPPLVLAALLFAQGAGSLELTTLAQAPPADAAPFALALRWLGAVGMALALPVVLEVGAFDVDEGRTAKARRHADPRTDGSARLRAFVPWWSRLRALGYVLLVSLPLAAPLTAGGAPPWAVLLTPLAPLTLAALVWVFARATAARPALPWARAYLFLSAVLLLAHTLAAAEALRVRLA